MKVWVLQSEQGRLHGDVHRESADGCPRLIEEVGAGDEVVLLDVEDVPARQPVCGLVSCFPGIERAGQLVRSTQPKAVEFEPFEPTKRVKLKPAMRGSRSRRTPAPRRTTSPAPERTSVVEPPPEPAEPAEPVVEVGSSVTFEFLDSGETKTLRLVEGAAKLTAGEISAGTPYGKAMLGTTEDDRVTVELPGREREVKILRFSPPDGGGP